MGETATAWATSGATIEVVSRMFHIPIPTIRSWERRYGVPSPARSAGGHRRYSFEDALELRAMRDEIGRGRRSAEAAALIRERRAARVDDDIAGWRERFLKAADVLDADAMRAALIDAVGARGIEPAIVDVALPSMRDIGFLWQAGVCDVANEHVATDVVRRWLGSLTADTPTTDEAPVVLACGPKDSHTIGLEALGVLLVAAGVPCRVLGALVPAASLARAVSTLSSRVAVVASHVAVARRAAIDAIVAVSTLDGVSVAYSGAAFTSAASRRDLPGTYLGEDFRAARDLVAATYTAVMRRQGDRSEAVRA